MNKNTKTSLTDHFTLANGVQIPCIGDGTRQTPGDGTMKNCVRTAIE